MSDDLVKRLAVKSDPDSRDAANRIEELEDRTEDLMAELREARFQSLADLCQVEEAYDAQMKAEAENARLREAGRFLIERLMEFELSDNAEDMCREYMGHVEPAAERLKIALESSNFSEKVQLDDGK